MTSSPELLITIFAKALQIPLFDRHSHIKMKRAETQLRNTVPTPACLTFVRSATVTMHHQTPTTIVHLLAAQTTLPHVRSQPPNSAKGLVIPAVKVLPNPAPSTTIPLPRIKRRPCSRSTITAIAPLHHARPTSPRFHSNSTSKPPVTILRATKKS